MLLIAIAFYTETFDHVEVKVIIDLYLNAIIVNLLISVTLIRLYLTCLIQKFKSKGETFLNRFNGKQKTAICSGQLLHNLLNMNFIVHNLYI